MLLYPCNNTLEKCLDIEPRTRYSSGWKYVTPSNPQLVHFQLESAFALFYAKFKLDGFQ